MVNMMKMLVRDVKCFDHEDLFLLRGWGHRRYSFKRYVLVLGWSAKADPHQEVVLVPVFTGLGVPYWRPDCRGAIFGLTRGTGPAEMARAALESVGFQTRDLLAAMWADWVGHGTDAILRVDGGLSASDWAMQFLADILEAPVDRPEVLETTALGAAWLAGMRAGLYPEKEAPSRSCRKTGC